MENHYKSYLSDIVELSKQAGAAILEIYQREGELAYKVKKDKTLVTEADLLANLIITKRLAELTPELPVLSEEGVEIPFSERKKWDYYWLVDPLDGTNEFLAHSGEFTVNIALIHKHKPVLGVSFAPVANECFYAYSGGGAFCEEADGKVRALHTNKIAKERVKVVISRALGVKNVADFLEKIPDYELCYFGGSLKLCMVAAGKFDLYPRMGFNCEWDTAAGQCIVEEAGGAVVDLALQPLQYNTNDSLLNPSFLVIGDPDYWIPRL